MNQRTLFGLLLIAGGVGYWLYARNKSQAASLPDIPASGDPGRLETWSECVGRLGVLNGSYDCLFDANKIRVSATGGPR